MKKVLVFIATGFGTGYSPVCPGTVGTLVGIPLAVLLTALHGSLWLQIAIALALTVLAIPVCDIAEKYFGKTDDGRIVADEYMLFPICFIAQEPIWELFFGATPDPLRAVLFIVLAFVVARFFDILKPFPAYQVQSLHGGLGIVMDDFFASVYSWIAIWLINKYVLAPHILPFVRDLIG